MPDPRVSILAQVLIQYSLDLQLGDPITLETSPLVEDSAEGYIRFSYPVNYNGQEIQDIGLWFENGKVVNEQASKNVNLLTKTLDTKEGARYLGE
jgi:leucyl aminopeptidase (aminopeptidase T)